MVTAFKQGRALMAIALPKRNSEQLCFIFLPITLVFSLLFRSVGYGKLSLSRKLFIYITLWLKRWSTDPRVPGSSPTIATGIFSPRSLLSSAQKMSRCSLKVFPPDTSDSPARQLTQEALVVMRFTVVIVSGYWLAWHLSNVDCVDLHLYIFDHVVSMIRDSDVNLSYCALLCKWTLQQRSHHEGIVRIFVALSCELGGFFI